MSYIPYTDEQKQLSNSVDLRTFLRMRGEKLVPVGREFKLVYLYDRDENGEYFFGIPKGKKIEVHLLTSPEDLYEYLAEESKGFSLIARKEVLTN